MDGNKHGDENSRAGKEEANDNTEDEEEEKE